MTPERTSRARRECRRALLAITAVCATLALGAVSSVADGSGETERSTGDGSPQLEQRVRSGGMQFRISVSRTANLFHWIDNLAGSSFGKTRDVYRRYWTRHIGGVSKQDRMVLADFRDARLWFARERAASAGGGCLPGDASQASIRQQLSAAAMRAADNDELKKAAAELLPAEHARAIAEGLDRFDARFEKWWIRAHDLGPFARELTSFLSERRTGRLIERMGALVGADLGKAVPVTLSLIPLPETGPTHAEADAHHLLLEIRPEDRVELQVAVVFHELAHDLLARVPHDALEARARRLFTAGPAGALTWALMREALPTALGQGVAQVELARRSFDPRDPWYHLREIDALAREIFDPVRAAMRRGAALDGDLLEKIVAIVSERSLSSAALPAFFPEGSIAASSAGAPALEPMRRAMRARSFLVRWDEPDAASFILEHPCMPLMLLTTRAELHALSARLGADIDSLLSSVPPASKGALGAIVPGRRASGAPALLVLAEIHGDLDAMVRSAGKTQGWPAEVAIVPRPPAPGAMSR